MLYINGKFTAQSTTGVQRAAHETVVALDRLLGTPRGAHAPACVLLHPPGGHAPALRHIQVRAVGAAVGGLTAWEQAVLPWASRRGWLANLAGSAPWWAAPRSLCVMHDAAVFDHPDSFTPAFRIWYRSLFRHLGRRAAGLMTVSHFSQQRLAAALELPADRLRVAHNGADHFDAIEADATVLPAYGLQPGRFLLAVGTAKRTKNIGAVLAAWRRMARRDGRVLVWVGGDNHRVFAPSVATGGDDVALGIYRVGVLSDAKLKALYQNAAGLVAASTYEGFGFPAVEAMSCGCAVAASAAAALPEVCGDAALYFDPDDVDSIARAMLRLLDDETLRRTLQDRGRQRAAQFRWDSVAQQVLDAVSCCCERTEAR